MYFNVHDILFEAFEVHQLHTSSFCVCQILEKVTGVREAVNELFSRLQKQPVCRDRHIVQHSLEFILFERVYTKPLLNILLMCLVFGIV